MLKQKSPINKGSLPKPSSVKEYLELTSPIKNLKKIKAENDDIKNYKNDLMMKLNVVREKSLKKKNKYAFKFHDNFESSQKLNFNENKENAK